MIRPYTANNITLKDLKHCKMTPVFFDTFFNLEKYLDHEQRDPFATQRETDEDGNEVCSHIVVLTLLDNIFFSCLIGTGLLQKNTSFLLLRKEIMSLWMTCKYGALLKDVSNFVKIPICPCKSEYRNPSEFKASVGNAFHVVYDQFLLQVL